MHPNGKSIHSQMHNLMSTLEASLIWTEVAIISGARMLN